MCKLPHGNAAFGERSLPEIAPLGLIYFNLPVNGYEFFFLRVSAPPREIFFKERKNFRAEAQSRREKVNPETKPR
jgi:hypothetical protein